MLKTCAIICLNIYKRAPPGWSLLFILFVTSSCQGSPLKDFQSLRMDMDKGEVLEIMGSPQRTQRFHGKDRWTYIFFEKEKKYEKEVHLLNGKAVYIGDVWQTSSEMSAENIDLQNEKSHQEVLKNEATRNEELKKHNFTEYEKSVKGEGKVRYLPNYKPIK